jgi:hypothetical protein
MKLKLALFFARNRKYLIPAIVVVVAAILYFTVK